MAPRCCVLTPTASISPLHHYKYNTPNNRQFTPPLRASETKKGKIFQTPFSVLKKEKKKTMACSSRAVSASLSFFFLLLGFSAAKELLVGGKIDAWKIPSSEVDSLNQWAEKSRFRVGDYLGNLPNTTISSI